MKGLCVYIMILVLAHSRFTEASFYDVYGSANCEQGWLHVNGSCLYFESEKVMNFNDAEQYCADLGSDTHLASCLTADEAQVIKTHVLYFVPKNNSWLTGYRTTAGKAVNADESPEITAAVYFDSSYRPNSILKCLAFNQKALVKNVDCVARNNFICKRGPTSCAPKYFCPRGWMRDYDRCYLVNYNSPQSFVTAMTDCKAKGAQLLELTTDLSDYWYIKGYFNFEKEFTPGLKTKYWLAMNDPKKWLFSGKPVSGDYWCDGKVPTTTTKGIGVLDTTKEKLCWSWCQNCRSEAYICEMQASLTNCPDGWVKNGEDCYKFETSEQVHENDAEQECIKQNAHLASCFSTEDALFMKNYIKKTHPGLSFYVGLNQHNSERLIKNADGTDIPEDLPGLKYPIVQSTKHCVAFDENESNLSNIDCTVKTNYICKKGPTSCAPKHTCYSGWVRDYETCYLFYEYPGSLPYSYDSAEGLCRAQMYGSADPYPSRLIEINSAKENSFIESTIYPMASRANLTYWLGLKNSKTWNSQTTISFTDWCEQPQGNATGYGLVSPDKYCWSLCSTEACSKLEAVPLCEKLAVGPAPAQPCKKGWQRVGDSCFLFVFQEANAFEAEANCGAWGGSPDSHLASCLSTEEATFLHHYIDQFATGKYFFIGINQNNEYGLTRNLDGSIITGTLPFRENWPIEFYDQKCFVFGDRTTIVNYFCTLKAYYICKTGPTSCGPKK